MNRKCIIKTKEGEEKGIFHKWMEEADVIAPSLMVGGHPGGQVARTLGIVEKENGEIMLVYPTIVRFVDIE